MVAVVEMSRNLYLAVGLKRGMGIKYIRGP